MRRTRLKPQSQRTIDEKDIRTDVRETRLRLNRRCEAPARGMPGRCGRVSSTREDLEVHEIVGRDLAPGSHLVLGLTATLCQRHHDAVTSPEGGAADDAEAAGLCLPSTAVGYAYDDTANRRLPFLLEAWRWARP